MSYEILEDDWIKPVRKRRVSVYMSVYIYQMSKYNVVILVLC